MRPRPVRAAALGLATILIVSCGKATVPARSEATPPSSPPIVDADLLTETSGWVLTTQDLRWTDDGGDTWRDITPPHRGTRGIESAFFVDEAHGWAMLREPDPPTPPKLTVYRTTDGGRTWSDTTLRGSDTGEVSIGTSLAFVDARHGWLMYSTAASANLRAGELFRTEDGGGSWQRLDIPLGEPIRFGTTSLGFVAGGPAGDGLFVTHDGGTTWRDVGEAVPRSAEFTDSPPTYSLPTVVGGTNVILPVTYWGEAGGLSFAVSDDSGATWEAIDGPQAMTRAFGGPGVEAATSVTDALTWAAIVNTRLYVTTDGGTSWSATQTEGLQGVASDLDFASGRVGWARTQDGVCRSYKSDCAQVVDLARTEDGGRTWTALLHSEEPE